MIELRYNEDGKLEYRTTKLVRSNTHYGVPSTHTGETVWNEWKIVPSEQTKSYTSGIVPKGYISGVAWVHREAVDAIEQELEKVKQERDEHKARVAQLEAEKQTLLESEMWGVNCKPSASNAESVAWGVRMPGHEIYGKNNVWSVRPSEKIAKEVFPESDGWVHFPLYTEPQPVKEWLTKEERDEFKARVEGLIKQRDCLSKQLESVSTPVAVWRRLEIGEIIKETDQYCLFSGGKWFPANSSSVGLPHNESQCEYRRCESALQPAKSWLTAEERRTLSETAYVLDDRKAHAYGRFVRSLLARSTPPEVVRPVTAKPHEFSAVVRGILELRDKEWFEALAAAGVKVKK